MYVDGCKLPANDRLEMMLIIQAVGDRLVVYNCRADQRPLVEVAVQVLRLNVLLLLMDDVLRSGC